ncbi:MAG TPA: YetF domain-containing protein [Burkholderiaceae bacterium]|nr:YetF domain-containing protein [Burkholderiaceae bacterium]
MGVDWGSLFEFTVSPLELIVRGSIIYWFVFTLLRLAGRRDFGSVGMANILLLVMIADAAQNGMAGDYKTIPEGMVLIATLVFWSSAIDRLCFLFPTVRDFLEPDRICLIKDGQLQRRGMRKEYITDEELLAELRLNGVDDVAQVRRAYIEPNGNVSVLKFSK